jgi:hypothetical protein
MGESSSPAETPVETVSGPDFTGEVEGVELTLGPAGGPPIAKGTSPVFVIGPAAMGRSGFSTPSFSEEIVSMITGAIRGVDTGSAGAFVTVEIFSRCTGCRGGGVGAFGGIGAVMLFSIGVWMVMISGCSRGMATMAARMAACVAMEI